MKVIIFQGQVRKRASSERSLTKRQSVVNIRNKNDFRGIISVLAQLHPPGDNPIRVSDCTKNLHEIKTNGTHLIDGLKVDDIEKIKKTEKN